MAKIFVTIKPMRSELELCICDLLLRGQTPSIMLRISTEFTRSPTTLLQKPTTLLQNVPPQIHLREGSYKGTVGSL